MKRTWLFPLVIVLFLSYGEASEGAALQSLRYWSTERYTRVVIDVDSPVEFTQNRLSNPERLYFDLKNCILPKDIAPSLPIGNTILKGARAAQFDKNTVRVVLDLGSFESFNVFTIEEPYRIVIDVYGKERPVPPLHGEEGQRFMSIKRVVIDPGHGGKDPGAVGPNGLYEKDVVLDVAKKLKRILKERYNMEVILTRDKDIFIPLEERTAIANSKKADLFISIHVNAHTRRSAKGIETYILNWTDDEEAMRVAARENAISFKKMKKIQDDLQIILHDLARNNKRDESMRLAHNVQSSIVDILKGDYREIIDLGVKGALFYVLVGAEMPSILAEISFISNREEERRLLEDGYRNKIAEAIAKGVEKYSGSLRLVSPVRNEQLPVSNGVKRHGDKI